MGRLPHHLAVNDKRPASGGWSFDLDTSGVTGQFGAGFEPATNDRCRSSLYPTELSSGGDDRNQPVLTISIASSRRGMRSGNRAGIHPTTDHRPPRTGGT